jgi:hypothetical protein
MSTAVPTPPRRRFGRRRTTPGKVGRLSQLRQVLAMTRRADPAVVWYMLLAFALVLVVGLGIGIAVDHPVYVGVIFLPLAVLAAMFVLARRAERAAYSQIEGRPGAASQSLRMLRRGWTVSEEPVAIDTKTQDTVFRAVGRSGVVLIGDGPKHRIGRLLAAEEKKVKRVVPGVPVHLVQAGSDDGQVPLRKLGAHITRIKATLTKQEVEVVNKRLKALGGMRPPIPKGVDPMRARPDRKSMRGR